MYCDKCGAENRDEAEFCVNCGKKISRNATPVRPSEGQPSGGKPLGGGEDDYIEDFKAAVSHRYKIIRELGRGGMAIVFLAEDNRLERKVALKLLPQEFSYDENFAKRFLREAKISAKLLHPNIIQIHDVDTSGGFYYYSMAYIEGISLDQIIKKSGALKPRVIARIMVLVSFALQQAHERGVIHRDIKPENIIINKKRQPIVVDFGIAKAQRSAKLSQTGMFIGTPMYMSPEQIKAEEVDGRSDIYSMGCVLYQMATGKTPFYGIEQTALLYKQVNELPPEPESINQNVPKELSDIIMKALAKNPDDRFQSAAELGKALHEAFLAAASRKPVAAAAPALAHGKAAAAPQVEDREIAETMIQSPETRRIEEALEEAAREREESPGAIGDTLTAPAVMARRKKKAAPKAEQKKKVNVPVVAAMALLAAILMFSFYNLLPEKKNEQTTPVPPGAQKTEQPSSAKKSVAQKQPPEKTAAKTTAAPRKPVQRQATESRTPASSTTQRKTEPVRETAREPVRETPSAPVREQPKVSQPAVKAAEKKPEKPAVEPRQPESTPVASLVKPEVKPEKKVEQPKPAKRVSITWMQIPGGTFMMGDSQGDMEEQLYVRPAHKITVSSFILSRDEITVEQYAVFLKATGHPEPTAWSTQMSNPERPVVYVSWNDAAAFAKWAGARLPTEAEWEYAARGGFEAQKYPWGNASPEKRANYGNDWQGGKAWRTALKKPGTYPPNRFGLNDMSGNVWEWCADWFAPYKEGLAVNPTGASSGAGKVVRGGGWNTKAKWVRNSVRGGQSPGKKLPHTGFRIAKNAR